MGQLALPYVILPGAAAVAAAWAIADWRLAGALAAGAGAALSVLPGLGIPLLIFVFPVLAGAGIAGLVLLPLLFIRPGISVWTRMTAALALTVAAGLWLISSNPGVA
ncbi:MAG: hypothetical protein KJN93_08925 [Alphaproteobacteria bacterium]|nr:hypothetical protein [Alphaproteobacteria bacterium]